MASGLKPLMVLRNILIPLLLCFGGINIQAQTIDWDAAAQAILQHPLSQGELQALFIDSLGFRGHWPDSTTMAANTGDTNGTWAFAGGSLYYNDGTDWGQVAGGGGGGSIAMGDITNTNLTGLQTYYVLKYNGGTTDWEVGLINSSNIQDGSVLSADIGNDQVNSNHIADGSVASIDIAYQTITSNDLGVGSVTSSAIADGTIIIDDLATNIISTDRIQDDAVTQAKVANDAISVAEIDPTGGTDGQVLGISSGAPTWVTPAGGGNVSNSGTPADNQVAIWVTSTTAEGSSNLTFDGTNLSIGGTTVTPGANVSKVGTPVANRIMYWTGDGTAGHEAGFEYDPTTNNLTIAGNVDGRDVSVDGTKLDGIESGATADQTNSEIETAYNAQVSIVSQAEAEAGTATTVRRWTAQRVAQAIAALGGSGASNLADQNDVTFTSLASGNLLRYNGTNWVNVTTIGGDNITNGSITNVDLAVNAVYSANINDLTITNADIANATIDYTKLVNLTIPGAKIADDAITTVKIQDGQVFSGDLAGSSVTEDKIASGAVTVNKIGATAVSSAKIAAGAVTSNKIANDNVTVEDLDGGATASNSQVPYRAGTTDLQWAALTPPLTDQNAAAVTLDENDLTAPYTYLRYKANPSSAATWTLDASNAGMWIEVTNISNYDITLSAGTGVSFGAGSATVIPGGGRYFAVIQWTTSTTVDARVQSVLEDIFMFSLPLDETTAITTGTSKISLPFPRAGTLTDIKAYVTTAPTGGALTIDINESGTSILSTKITIDATENHTNTAATAAVISDATIAEDAVITVDIDGVNGSPAGLKIYMYYEYTE